MSFVLNIKVCSNNVFFNIFLIIFGWHLYECAINICIFAKLELKEDASLTMFFQVVIQKSMDLNELGINRSGNSNLQDILN